METKEEISCLDCRHYVEHYIRNNSFEFKSLGRGHCRERRYSAKLENSIPEVKNCKYYEKRDEDSFNERIATRIKSLFTGISNMINFLEENNKKNT